MANKTYLGSEARNKLKEGIDIVYGSVAHTLGANGRNSVYNKWTRVPIITNDGVSIARENEPEDLTALQGANLLKQVSEATNDVAGDGTTTSIILAHAMITEGMSVIENVSGINPMKLRRQMRDAADKVLQAIKDSAIKISTLEELENVATISVESPEIGKVIAKAIYDAGDNGIVYVNDSEKVGVSVEQVDGYQFQQGMVTPYLITNPEKMETVLENAAVIITDIQVNLNDDFIRIIDAIRNQQTKDILLICDEFHPDVIKFAVQNLSQGKFRLSIVKKPMQGDLLEDIASLTASTAMTSQKGMIKYLPEYIGGAKKIIINQFTTTIIDGSGSDNTLTYVANLKTLAANAEDENTKVKLQERIAKITGGVYMLNVGDTTEAEAKYLRLKVDDAVNATKAAKQEGIVAGGGITLLKATNIFDKDESKLNEGELIIIKSCAAPLRKIIENSGENFDDIISQLEKAPEEGGFNAEILTVIPDMIKAGIIDPVKVTRTAFANAASFAGLFLTIECVITPLPESATKHEPKY